MEADDSKNVKAHYTKNSKQPRLNVNPIQQIMYCLCAKIGISCALRWMFLQNQYERVILIIYIHTREIFIVKSTLWTSLKTKVDFPCFDLNRHQICVNFFYQINNINNLNINY